MLLKKDANKRYVVDNFMLITLFHAEVAGFGSVFRGWITALFSGIHSVVWVNGHLSRPCIQSIKDAPLVTSVCIDSRAITVETDDVEMHPA